MKEMQAFVKYGTGPFETELRHLPVPEPEDAEVVVSVAGCGVCGSDLHAYRATAGYEWIQPPVILGHEFGGTIIRKGAAVRQFTEGDQVAVVGIQGCGRCPVCSAGDTNLCADRKVIGLNMDGGMADFAVVDARYLIRIPDSLDLTMAALLEPASVAAHALSKTRILPADRVVVSGPGPIGLFCGLIAALGGARVLMVGAGADAKIRLPLARRLGLDTFDITAGPLEMAESTAFNGAQPDLWVEASGSPQAFRTAVNRVRRGGRIVIVGIYSRSFEWMPTTAVRAGHSLFFSYASAARDYHFILNLMDRGRLDAAPLANIFPLSQANAAFRAAMAGKTVKPVLVPDKH